MPSDFQIFPFKIEGRAETKPPSQARRTQPSVSATPLAQSTAQLKQLAAQLKQLAAELSASATRLAGQPTQPPKSVSQLAREAAEVADSAAQLYEFTRLSPPPTSGEADPDDEPPASAGPSPRTVAELAREAARLAREAAQLSESGPAPSESPAQLSETIARLAGQAAELAESVARLAEEAGQPSASTDEPPESADERSIRLLNDKSDEMARDLEREISRLLRSSATVQAEIRFYEGSFLVEATVTIISWLAPIALASARKSFEDGLSQIIGAATRRVIQPVLRELAPQSEPIRDIEVTPQPISSGSVPTQTSSSPSLLQRLSTFDGSRYFFLLIVVNTVLLIILLTSLWVFFTLLGGGNPRRIRIGIDTMRTEKFVAQAKALSSMAALAHDAASPHLCLPIKPVDASPRRNDSASRSKVTKTDNALTQFDENNSVINNARMASREGNELSIKFGGRRTPLPVSSHLMGIIC